MPDNTEPNPARTHTSEEVELYWRQRRMLALGIFPLLELNGGRAPRSSPIRKDLDGWYFRSIDTSAGPLRCHPWTAASSGKYASGPVGPNGKTASVQRWAYKRYLGSLGDREVVRHVCNYGLCHNHFHWLKGTVSDNARDREQTRLLKIHPAARKLTPDQIQTIRALVLYPNLSHGEIAAAFGIRVTLIRSLQEDLELWLNKRSSGARAWTLGF